MFCGFLGLPVFSETSRPCDVYHVDINELKPTWRKSTIHYQVGWKNCHLFNNKTSTPLNVKSAARIMIRFDGEMFERRRSETHTWDGC